jgi:hypothetical protein
MCYCARLLAMSLGRPTEAELCTAAPRTAYHFDASSRRCPNTRVALSASHPSATEAKYKIHVHSHPFLVCQHYEPLTGNRSSSTKSIWMRSGIATNGLHFPCTAHRHSQRKHIVTDTYYSAGKTITFLSHLILQYAADRQRLWPADAAGHH